MLMRFAHGPETIKLGDFVVRRLGYGAMRLPGKEVWGEPDDVATAHAVLKQDSKAFLPISSIWQTTGLRHYN